MYVMRYTFVFIISHPVLFDYLGVWRNHALGDLAIQTI